MFVQMILHHCTAKDFKKIVENSSTWKTINIVAKNKMQALKNTKMTIAIGNFLRKKFPPAAAEVSLLTVHYSNVAEEEIANFRRSVER
jgi:hypothetical protein